MEAFRKSDMYSFALVMWEVFRKTRVFQNDPNSAEDFALPYHMDVGPDPSFEEMRKVVCVAQRRPDMLDKWFQNEVRFLTASTALWSRMKPFRSENKKS